jgi:hypothetical protein
MSRQPHEESSTGRPVPPDPAAVAEEAVRARKLQRSIDVSVALITHTPDLTVGGSIDIVVAARRIALDLFPEGGATFDMIYRPRLMRAIAERFDLEGDATPMVE